MSDNYGGMTPPPPPAFEAPVQPSGGSPWLKILGCGCVVMLLALGTAGWFGWKVWKEKGHEIARQGLLQEQTKLRNVVQSTAPERVAELDEAFSATALVYQNKTIGREVGMMAFAVVVKRCETALKDQKVTTEEVDGIVAVLKDISTNPAGFEPNKYPEMTEK